MGIVAVVEILTHQSSEVLIEALCLRVQMAKEQRVEGSTHYYPSSRGGLTLLGGAGKKPKAESPDFVEELVAVGKDKVVAMHCEHILQDDENVGQVDLLRLRACELAGLVERDLHDGVEEGVLEGDDDVDEGLLVVLEVGLEGELVEEPQVGLFEVAVALEEVDELGHQGMQGRHH